MIESFNCQCFCCRKRNVKFMSKLIRAAHRIRRIIFSPEFIDGYMSELKVNHSGTLCCAMDERQLYFSHDKHRWSLGKDERNFLRIYREFPKSQCFHNDLVSILSSAGFGRFSDDLLNRLEKHGVIYRSDTDFKGGVGGVASRVLEEVLRSAGVILVLREEANSMKSKSMAKALRGAKISSLIKESIDWTIIDAQFITGSYKEDVKRLRAYYVPLAMPYPVKLFDAELAARLLFPVFSLNRNYLKEDNIALQLHDQSQHSSIKNVFNSPHEREFYRQLREQNPEAIIVPNQQISRIVDLNEMRTVFSKDELGYLRNASVDFAIYNGEGAIAQVIELQIGKHHRSKEYAQRDNLKKALFEKCGINFREIFGEYDKSFMK